MPLTTRCSFFPRSEGTTHESTTPSLTHENHPDPRRRCFQLHRVQHDLPCSGGQKRRLVLPARRHLLGEEEALNGSCRSTSKGALLRRRALSLARQLGPFGKQSRGCGKLD